MDSPPLFVHNTNMREGHWTGKMLVIVGCQSIYLLLFPSTFYFIEKSATFPLQGKVVALLRAIIILLLKVYLCGRFAVFLLIPSIFR